MTLKRDVLVSIITPCYNSADFLEETFATVKNQTFENWEWLLVDDCSKDNTVSLIESFQATDHRIKLIKLTENGGPAIARNKALAEAKGNFIAFLDSDDLWNHDFLEKCITFLITNNEAFVYTSYKRVDEQLKPKLSDFIAIDKVDYKRLLFNNPIFPSTVVYDKSKVGEVWMPVSCHSREDFGFWFEILKNVKYARAIKEPLVTYRIRGNSYSRNKFKMMKTQFAVYYKHLNLSLLESIFYTCTWAISGIIKYSK
ncbi:MAG: glycosyltransferase family 2 protein [Chitinophagaceae bacterium]